MFCFLSFHHFLHMLIGSMCGIFIYMCSICMVNVPVNNPMYLMRFGHFFHDFHMSGSGIRIHNFRDHRNKKSNIKFWEVSIILGCHRHVTNKTDSCSQICVVFVSTKCTHPKKNKTSNSKTISYQSNSLVSVVSRLFSFIDIFYTRTIFKPHPKYTIPTSFFFCCCLQMFSFPVPNFFPVQVEVVNLKRELSDQGDSIEESRSVALVSPQVSYRWEPHTSMILPTYPGEIPQIFPKPPTTKNPSENIGEGVRGIFQGVRG